MNIVEGDLLQLEHNGNFDAIVHGCNCYCTFGAGLAKQIKFKYPQAFAEDMKTIKGDKLKLRTFSVAKTENFFIINAYTQYGISSYKRYGVNFKNDVFEYEAFNKILDSLAKDYPHFRFRFPLIGCGLAGGNKNIILSIIEEFESRIKEIGGSVTIVDYKENNNVNI